MNTSKLLIGLVIVVFAAAGYLQWQLGKIKPSEPGVASFNFVLEGKQYKPDTVSVGLGDTVVFNIDNRDNEDHGLHLPEFGVAEAIPALQKRSIQFVASRSGTAATSCASGHPEKITVIVES